MIDSSKRRDDNTGDSDEYEGKSRSQAYNDDTESNCTNEEKGAKTGSEKSPSGTKSKASESSNRISKSNNNNNGTTNKSQPSGKSSLNPSRKINLGAAADFGKKDNEATSKELIDTTLTGHKSETDLLADLFSPSLPSQPVSATDFADFSQFHSQSKTSNHSSVTNADEFADFASAFDEQPNPSVTNTTTTTTTTSNLPMSQSQPQSLSSLLSQTIQPKPSSIQVLSPVNQPTHASQPVKFLGFDQILTPQRPTELLSPVVNSLLGIGNHCDNSGANKLVGDCKKIPSPSENNTWSSLPTNVNINVDDLLGSKYEKKVVPSMNQLATHLGNTNLTSPSAQPVSLLGSPTSQVRPVGPSPVLPGKFAFCCISMTDSNLLILKSFYHCRIKFANIFRLWRESNWYC